MNASDKSKIEIKEWEETRLRGNPGHGFPPYDFVFRSHLDNWESRDKLIELARREWTDVRIQNRKVKMETSPWEESES